MVSLGWGIGLMATLACPSCGYFLYSSELARGLQGRPLCATVELIRYDTIMNQYRAWNCFLLVLTWLCLLETQAALAQAGQAFGDSVVVSFVIDGPGEQNDMISSTFIDEITALTRD